MWEIRNNTNFAVAGLITVDKTGERHWVVIVKGTFAIDENGRTQLAEEQVPLISVPRYRGEPGSSSLIYEQDLVAVKPSTDIYLNATAYAPGGRPCSEVEVTLRSPTGQKALVARGDRTWRSTVLGIQPSTPEPFVKMPITYERAYGGFDRHDSDERKQRMHDSNPVGTGFVANQRHRIGQAVPNIGRPGTGAEAEAAGFGALCSYWQPRRAYQGTYDDAWVNTQKPLLPSDYDRRALQCAPADQQATGYLRGGEVFALTNMHPTRPAISFLLPKHHFGLLTTIGERRLDHHGRITTVVIEPDHPRVIVTWHSVLSCHRDIDNIDYTVVIEKRQI
jgi:hypothetical protein